MRQLALLCALCAPATAAEFTAQESDKGVTVKLDGQLFTNYLITGKKPILSPLIGTTGKPLTRPLGEGDHPHQQSFWFTHGNVNGIDFWHAGGTIAHREFVKIAGGKTATISTRNEWRDSGGLAICRDERVLTFGVDGDARWIDFDVTVTPAGDSVTFGDTKEGSFGVRVFPTMTVKNGGTIINSNGEKNEAAWSKNANWVDYHGTVDGETVGIAILNHPTSFRFPTRWHVRTYGLFAANPFMKSKPVVLKQSDSLALRYRVILHKGDEKQGRIAESYAAYAKLKKQ